MDLRLDLDLSQLKALGTDWKRAEREVKRLGQALAGQTHLHILEQAQSRLHSRREIYVKALVRPVEVAPDTWMILLDPSGVWIEEGMPPHSMVDDLLAKDFKVSKKDGSRYRVIPFNQSKAPTRSTPAEQQIAQAIKNELKTLRKESKGHINIPWGKVERNPDGSPKTGVLHEFKYDIHNPRPAGTEGTANLTNDPRFPKNQHGYGHGDVGQQMQGPSPRPDLGVQGTPFLRGLRIVQTALWKRDGNGNRVPDLDKHGNQRAVRSFMSFRVVSSKHKGTKWQFPGIEGTHFFDQAYDWAQRTWEQQMLPEILKQLGAS